MSAAGNSTALRWPAERFYWAVLDVSALPRSRRRPEQLGYLLERYLPVPLEDVHAVYRRLPGERCLACAIPVTSINGNLDPAVRSLAPEALPAAIAVDLEPESINLLTGRYLPPRLRRATTRWLVMLNAIIIGIAVLLFAGLERRAAANRTAVTAANQEQQQVLVDALGASPTGGQPLAARLVGELRRLRSTRADVGPAQCFDALPPLAALFERWPAGVETRLESVSAGERSLSVLVRVPDTAQTEPLIDAFKDLPGWQLAQPGITSVSGEVQLTLTFSPQGDDS